jgi:deoxyguanosine kinase
MVIALDGLPGAGKTTAAYEVGTQLGANVIRETTADHPFLAQVYDDTDRDDLTVELAFLIVHANAYRRVNRNLLTVCDYSPAKDLLFAEEMLGGAELDFFRSAHETIYEQYPLPDLAVYLRAEPSLCLERVQRRLQLNPKRAFEHGLTVDRLERMRGRYETSLDRLANAYVVYEVIPDADEHQVAEEIVELLRPRLDSVPAGV